MQRYKDVLVAKGSDLADALASGNRKSAEKVYSETAERYKKLYPEADRAWFKEVSLAAQPTVLL
jgi:hypothetical protein